MANHDDLFALAKKLAKALSKGNEPKAIEDSNLFTEEAKQRIRHNLSEEVREQQIETLKTIDTDDDWQKVVSQLTPRKTSSFRPLYKVAAAILISISIGYFTLHDRNDTSDAELTITTISPGTDKAILTLQNGDDIVLEKDKPFENEAVSGNGERLDYSKATVDANSKIGFNYLSIPRGGQYQLQLADGTQVWLNADTKLKYPMAFKSGETRLVELLYGEAYFEVSPSSHHDGSAFKVLTKQQEVVVHGTEFNIKAYNDEQHIYTTLVEGQVDILVNGLSEQLNPSEQTTFDTNAQLITKSVVNVDYHIAWLKGSFHFKDSSLKEIMQVLSRWYDVDFIFESQSLEAITFSGLLSKTQNLEDILNGIKNTQFINAYEIENKTITIK